jgi:hypothetical protein
MDELSIAQATYGLVGGEGANDVIGVLVIPVTANGVHAQAVVPARYHTILGPGVPSPVTRS